MQVTRSYNDACALTSAADDLSYWDEPEQGYKARKLHPLNWLHSVSLKLNPLPDKSFFSGGDLYSLCMH